MSDIAYSLHFAKAVEISIKKFPFVLETSNLRMETTSANARWSICWNALHIVLAKFTPSC